MFTMNEYATSDSIDMSQLIEKGSSLVTQRNVSCLGTIVAHENVNTLLRNSADLTNNEIEYLLGSDASIRVNVHDHKESQFGEVIKCDMGWYADTQPIEKSMTDIAESNPFQLDLLKEFLVTVNNKYDLFGTAAYEDEGKLHVFMAFGMSPKNEDGENMFRVLKLVIKLK